MTIAEHTLDISPADLEIESNNAPWRIRLFAIQSLLQYMEISLQRKQQLINKVKNIGDKILALSDAKVALERAATEEDGQLLLQIGIPEADSWLVKKRKEELRIAQIQYDKQIYPTGVTTETVDLTAPTFKKSFVDGEPQLIELDPLTLEPKETG